VGLLVGMSGSGGDLSSLFGRGVAVGAGPPNWNWQRYQDSMPLLLEVGIGFRISDWLAVGFSLEPERTAWFDQNYPVAVTRFWSPDRDFDRAIPSNRGDEFRAGRTARRLATGFQCHPLSDRVLEFGYVYKPEAWSRYKLPVELIGARSLSGDRTSD